MASRRLRRVGLLTGGGDCPGVGRGRMKKVPLRSDIVQSARDMGIGFGD
jgi:hypothetical protein